MFYSSGDAKGNHGVGVVLGPRARDKVISVCYVDNRVMVVRLQGKKVDLVIMQIYMPHNGVADEEGEDAYDKIEETVEKEKKEACVILMGDWNGIVGEGEDRRTVGRYGLGKGTRSASWFRPEEDRIRLCDVTSLRSGFSQWISVRGR